MATSYFSPGGFEATLGRESDKWGDVLAKEAHIDSFKNVGSSDLPAFFDSNGVPQPCTGLQDSISQMVNDAVSSAGGSGSSGSDGALTDIISTRGLMHNGVYRGANLGTITSLSELETFLTEHKVAEGVFTDLYVGDYLTIQDGTYNKEWEIAGFDCYLHKGDTDFTSHHICLIPKNNLTTSYMNSSDTTSGGFVGSYMYKTVLPTVNSKLAAVLGNHLLTRRALLSKTVNTNIASGAGAGWMGASTDWAWYDVKACLMSEVAVYGSRVFSSSFYDVGEDCERLPIFHFKGHSYTREWFWLKAVASASGFAVAGNHGHADGGHASHAGGGVRPLICVG